MTLANYTTSASGSPPLTSNLLTALDALDDGADVELVGSKRTAKRPKRRAWLPVELAAWASRGGWFRITPRSEPRDAAQGELADWPDARPMFESWGVRWSVRGAAMASRHDGIVYTVARALAMPRNWERSLAEAVAFAETVNAALPRPLGLDRAREPREIAAWAWKRQQAALVSGDAGRAFSELQQARNRKSARKRTAEAEARQWAAARLRVEGWPSAKIADALGLDFRTVNRLAPAGGPHDFVVYTWPAPPDWRLVNVPRGMDWWENGQLSLFNSFSSNPSGEATPPRPSAAPTPL